MISVSGIKSSTGAARYYTTQDYYSEAQGIEGAWYGSGAEALGLAGVPSREAFQSVLEGRLPNGVTLAGGATGEHRPGWDFCFAPDKTVSVAALVYGDTRVVAAHEAAVLATLTKIDAEYAFARVRDAEGVRLVKAEGVVAATWTHESSRALDPQLHTHVTIGNAVRTADGQWRAMESRPLFVARHMLDAVYKAELAQRLQTLGYRLDVDRARGTFALTDIPKVLAEAYSQRAVGIETRLAQDGLTRAAASAQLRAAISEVSRGDKEHMDPATLRAHWQGIAREHGVDATRQATVVREASARGASAEWRERIAASAAYAARAVLDAAAKLAERDAVFGHEVLLRDAQGLALGRATFAQIERAASDALTRGDLLARTTDTGRAYTTPEAVARECAIIAIERQGRGGVAPALDRTEAWRAVARAELVAHAAGHTWNAEHKAATVGVLSTSDRIVGVQGIAGSAKTSTVLATVAGELRARGYKVTAIAPTASAARELGHALQTEGRTLAAHLGQLERERAGSATPNVVPTERRVWVVDEASLVSAKDMATLLRAAERVDARVILSGDVQQLGSVEAGRAFAQLQSAGMETQRLHENVRQQNESLREAVKDASEGRFAAAMEKLERGGGRIAEIDSRAERLKAVAQDYVARDSELRRQTIVVDNTRQGRADLTDEIRGALHARGELGLAAITIQALERRDLTTVERKLVESYRPGDTVTFQRNYTGAGLLRENTYTVDRVDKAAERVILRDGQGTETAWNPRVAMKAEVFETKAVELRAGDRIAFTRNDPERGVANNDRGTVRSVDAEKGQAIIETDRGRHTVTLDSAREADRFIRHGYVQTSYAAQGQTAKEVLMHAECASPATHQRAQYVQVSRAIDRATLYTDSRKGLVGAVERRDGEKSAALDGAPKPAMCADRAGAGAAWTARGLDRSVERGAVTKIDPARTRVEVSSEQVKTARTFSELAVAHWAHREAKAELAGQSACAPSIDKSAGRHSVKSGSAEKAPQADRTPSLGKGM